MKTKVLIFIPCYNCAQQISRVLAQFSNEFSEHITEVLIINNRSTDSTESTAIEFLKNFKSKIHFKVIRNVENYGLGGSQKVAFNYAIDNDFDYVGILHGDDQGQILDFLPVIENLAGGTADCYLGARFHPASKLQGYSRIRTLGNKVFNLLFSTLCHRRVYDLGAGLNLYRVKSLKNKYYLKLPDDLTFNYALLIAHAKLKHKFEFIPISWREDDQVSNVRLFSQGMKLLKIFLLSLLGGKNYILSEMRAAPQKAYSFTTIKEFH